MTPSEIDLQNIEAWENRSSDLQRTYKMATELIAHSEAHHYKKGIADARKILGYCYWRFSYYSLSLSNSMKALKTYEELKDRRGEADVLNNIGAVYMFQNDHKNRLDVNFRCREIRLEVGDLEGASSSDGNIGETYFEMGDYDNAMKYLESVLKNPSASPQGKAWSLHNIGRVKHASKNWDEALEYYQKGLELSESVSYNVLIIDSHLCITELFIDLKMPVEAILHAELSLKVSRRIGTKEGEKKALYFLSKMYEHIGEFKTSLKYYQDFHAIDSEISRDKEIERLKTLQLKVAYEKIEEQKNELVDSIVYAERIQTALLTREQEQDMLPDYFVFFQPRDIVSGDFYWYYEQDDYFYVCVADCTGHGVPGAFLTILGTTFLNEIASLNDCPSPGFILERLHLSFIRELSHLGENQDGMDVSVIRVHATSLKAEWAGAYNPLWVIGSQMTEVGTSVFEYKGYRLFEIKGNKFPVGYSDVSEPFTNHELQLSKGDRIYLFSDGFGDQFGGPKGKKIQRAGFKRMLIDSISDSMTEQSDKLKAAFEEWKGKLDSVDDVCVFGFML